MTHKSKYILITLLVLAVLIFVIGIFIVLNQSTNKVDNGVILDRISGPIDDGDKAVSTKLDNHLFYIKDNNILVFNLDTRTETKLTDYPKNLDYSPAYDESGNTIPTLNITAVKVVDENSIGFSKCAIVPGDYGCTLNILKLDTKEVTEVEKLNKDSNILNATFDSQDKYVYNFILNDQTSKKSFYKLVLVNGGTSKELENFEIEAYGRGSHPEDSEELLFSADSSNLMHISTASPRALFDANIYIYNLTNNTKNIVSNATQPAWLNNNSIIYRQFNSETNSGANLYEYNIDTKSTKKVPNTLENARFPTTLDATRIVYEEESNIVYLDLASNEKRTLVTNAANIKRISQDYVLYNEVTICNEDPNCGGIMGQFEYGKVFSLNIETGESIETSLDLLLTNTSSIYD
jgi:hypothetical protein